MKHLTLIIMIMVSGVFSIEVNAQIPPVSEAACSFCGGRNGVHASTCRYYVVPKTNASQPSPVVPNQLQQLNSVIDLMTSPNTDSKTTAEKELEKKQLAEQKATEERIRLEKSKQLTKQLKPLDAYPKKTKTSYKILKINGTVSIKKANGNIVVLNNQENANIETGDEIITGINSSLRLDLGVPRQFNEELVIGSSTVIRMEQDNFGEQYPHLINGKIKYSDGVIDDYAKQMEAELKSAFDKTEFGKRVRSIEKIRMGSGTASIRGTKFIANVSDNGSTEILLYEGELEIETNDIKEKIILTPGKKVKITSDSKIDTIEKIDINGFIEDFEK